MKKAILGFLLLGVAANAAEQWKVIRINYNTKMIGNSGLITQVPVVGVVDAYGFVRADSMSEFVVSVGPSSQQRGCVPIDSGSVNDRRYTGIVAANPNAVSYDTKLKQSYSSR
ncbi:hypothetical protein K2X33_12210, partial [bacterium]|nr:hypothetical protein [bacterium]